MSSLTARLLCVVGAILLAGGGGGARGQERTPAATAPAASATDPRVGLKPGLKDAGQAARNMELVASLPKPRASSIRKAGRRAHRTGDRGQAGSQAGSRVRPRGEAE